jgi:beta-carotene ketolase (CrtW type)
VLETERRIYAESALNQLDDYWQPSGQSTAHTLTSSNTYEGVAIAASILSLWLISLVSLLRLDHPLPIVWMALAILGQTFLYTGLFITAHDAMHGCVVPQHPRLNHAIGFLALLLYGFLPYYKLRTAHWQHHQYPASDRDPDYHNGKQTNGLFWYVRFMVRYWGWWQCVGITAAYHFMHRVVGVSELNLVAFWATPALLSSLQLFYFGTFLAHREPATGYQNAARANSIYRPILWSFLTCYHFGYHNEHHEHPHVPWWKLPAIVRSQSTE